MGFRVIVLLALIYFSLRGIALQSCDVYPTSASPRMKISSIKFQEQGNLNRGSEGFLSMVARDTLQNEEMIITSLGHIKAGDEQIKFVGSTKYGRASAELNRKKNKAEGILTLGMDTYKVKCD